MKKFSLIIALFSISVVFLVWAIPAQAQWQYGQPIVPCGLKSDSPLTPWNDKDECTACDLFKLLKNIIDFVLIGLMPPLATLLFVVAGFFWILGGANPGMYSRGKAIFSSTFWGVVVILLAWTITNTLLASLVTAPVTFKTINNGTFVWNPLNWWQVTCVTGPGGGPTTGGSGGDPTFCGDPSALAASLTNPVPYPGQRSNNPALNTLISCMNSRIGSMIDQSQIYTFERTNDLCNFTRGDQICGACSHVIFSCHYGGRTGTTGSMAVDFNAATGTSESALYQAIRLNATSCSIPLSRIRFESNHTHVSLASCDGY